MFIIESNYDLYGLYTSSGLTCVEYGKTADGDLLKCSQDEQNFADIYRG